MFASNHASALRERACLTSLCNYIICTIAGARMVLELSAQLAHALVNTKPSDTLPLLAPFPDGAPWHCSPPRSQAAVRVNAAAILREDALIKQKQVKEYETLKRYEQELHDASEFHRWQEKMKEQDHLDEERRVHQRIVEMQLAREGAIDAFEGQVRRKGILAGIQREELAMDMAVRAVEEQKELVEKQQLVKGTAPLGILLAPPHPLLPHIAFGF